MPSSYTPLLRLVLPVTGELTGTWGDTVNNGITSLVEDAVAGTASVVMADANVTLSANNEAPDQARCMFIVLSGANTALRDAICPARSKLYFVVNNTTGGQSIRFKTSAGTGITVANGKAVVLYCDGTNVRNAINFLTGDVTGNVTGNVTGTAANVTGIVALANGGTGAATQGPALQNLGALAADTQAKTATYTVVAGDRGDVIWCDGTFDLDLTAATTLADGFSFGVVNIGTGTITLDPNGAELIDGLASKDIAPGQSAFLITDGTSWRTVGLSGGGAKGGGANQIFYENDQLVTANYTVIATKNAGSFGPIKIDTGVTVTIATGATWSIV